MRRVMSSLAVIGLLGLAGCGDATTTSTTGPIPAHVALLTVEDLGDHWRAGAAINEADLSDMVSNMREPCSDVVINPTVVDRLTPTTAVQFEPIDGSRQHVIEFISTGEPSQLAMDLTVMFSGIGACIDKGANEATGLLRYEQMTLPELGDQRFATLTMAEEQPGEGPVWLMRIAIVRVSGVAVSLGVTEIIDTVDSPYSISQVEFERMLTAAVDALTS